MQNHQFPDSFILLQQEGYLIRSCLTTGLTELRKANVQNKGSFYSALFNLSTGFERFLKSIIIIDYMLNNDLSVPSITQLKFFGHNIIELYDSCYNIALNRSVEFPGRGKMDLIANNLLQLFSDFAKTTRYYNLNALSTSQKYKDPLFHWNEILQDVIQEDVSDYQISKILFEAEFVSEMIDEYSTTIMSGLDKKALSTFDIFNLPSLQAQAVKHVNFRIIKILFPIKKLIYNLSLEVYNLEEQVPPFPQMQEFFQWLVDDRQYILRKKVWP
jgi:hypothetical protein